MNAKKILAIAATALAVSTAAFAADETVTIRTLNSSRTMSDVQVKKNPQRLAMLDLATLDIIDALGLGDLVVGVPGTRLDYLQKYMDTAKIPNLGTIKNPNLEKIMAVEPDVIFAGLRLFRNYDALNEIAPTVILINDTSIGLIESMKSNINQIASLFDMGDKADEFMSKFDERIAAIREISKGKTAIVALVTSGGFNILGKDGRCSMISNEAGFTNIGLEGVQKKGDKSKVTTSTHGNEASFEFVLSKNPDYIFVMDRDAAIGAQGEKLAKEIVENELIMKTDAYKNGHIVYLAHPAVWYTAEGGITALDIMLKDLEVVLEK